MRSYLLAVLLFFVLSASAQNIVPNPDFSLHSTCPDNVMQISYCTGWTSATMGSPDYFNTCDLTELLGVPRNGFGIQSSVSHAYVGIWVFTLPDTNDREYVSADIPQLEQNALYKVTVVVSRAEISIYACDGFGVYFYKDAQPDSTLYYDPIPVIPQIDYSSYGVIEDSANWVVLSKTFIADSAYTHLIIGNFKPLGMVNYTGDTASSNYSIAYYYIDSIAVEKVHSATIANRSHNINMTLAPNPFTNYCTLAFDNPYHQPHQLSIYDIQGALVRQVNNITANEVTIQRDDMEKGIYFYQLRRPDNAVMRGKMIIQ